MIATHEDTEAARLELQRELDAAKSPRERNQLGQFATPPALAEQLVEFAASFLAEKKRLRFFDPAFGTGSFYSALLRAFSVSKIAAAAGYEIDPHYAEPAKRLWSAAGLQLSLEDFAMAAPPRANQAKPNLLICNPPYVRHHHLSSHQKTHLRELAFHRTGIRLNGLAGLYCYYLLLAHSWMVPGGAAGWLIPGEFMDVNYGSAVKRYLLKNVTLHRIHRFHPGDVQFDDALVSSVVAVFSNRTPPANHEVELTRGGSLAAPTSRTRILTSRLSPEDKWSSAGGPRRVGRQQRTLGDLFTIKRGLATGCNEFFVLSPARTKEHEIPLQFLRPILPSPRHLEVDEVPATADGAPAIARQLSLLCCDLPAERLQSEYPTLWRYLQEGIERCVNQRYLCRHRQPWYSQENRPPAPFLCSYMGRQGTRRGGNPFRFILNHSQATAANVYLMLYPKPAILDSAKNARMRRRVWRALSSITPDVLLGKGRVYGGGLHKLEPKELAAVPAATILDALKK